MSRCTPYADTKFQGEIYILGPKLPQWFFLQISQPSIFRLFAIFHHNFSKIVAPPSDENENLVHLKEQSFLKKR